MGFHKKGGEHQTAKIFANKDKMLTKSLDDLLAGKNVAIATDSKAFADNFSGESLIDTCCHAFNIKKSVVEVELAGFGPLDEINKALAAKKMLVITGQNSSDPEVKAVLKNPTLFKNYDLLVYTPALGSGVSIEESHFDSLYAFFEGVLTADEDIQSFFYWNNVEISDNSPKDIPF